jgi:hypothetical protein
LGLFVVCIFYLLVFRSIVTKKMMQKAFTPVHCSVACLLLEVVGCILVYYLSALGTVYGELAVACFSCSLLYACC